MNMTHPAADCPDCRGTLLLRLDLSGINNDCPFYCIDIDHGLQDWWECARCGRLWEDEELT